MEPLGEILETAKSGYLGWIIVFLVLTTFELLNPRGKQSLGSRVNGLAFWTVSIPLSAVALTLLASLWAALGIKPLLTLPLFGWLAWAAPLAGLVGGVLAAMVNDFFFYWFHRAQHRWLWRYHAVHHSIRELSAVNSYHHASEALMSLLLYTVPVSLIVSDVGPALPYISLGLWFHIVWIHSPTRANLGPLRTVFADNRYHRIHHSLEERHFDRNFGAFTTLWDRLFGTAYFPAPGEWPAVGLAGMDEPQGVREWLDFPARYAAAERAAAQSARPAEGGPMTGMHPARPEGSRVSPAFDAPSRSG